MSQRARWGLGTLGLAVLVAALGMLSGWERVATVSYAYPDLVAQPAADFSMDTVGGRPVLRFRTLSVNLGEAPLHLVRHESNGARSVWQYAQDGAGALVPLQAAGDFTYHPGHDHIHFTDYAVYVLRRPDGSNAQGLAQSGTKTTFCIMDTTRFDRKWPGAPKREQYRECGASYQGMSLGWGDTYGAHLADQWVFLDELMSDPGANSGDWVVEILIDPKRKLAEISTANNLSVAPVCLDLVGLAVEAGACGTDGPSGGGKPGNGRGRPPR